jgi:hypothetical protein
MRRNELRVAGILTLLCCTYSVLAEPPLNMSTIRNMCGPSQGHHDWPDQMECVLRVMPLSNNPDLMPSNPYIGWYTQMALNMIDDVKKNRISEFDARENVQQAYHEAMVRQSQAQEADNEAESLERRRVAAVNAQQQQSENNAQQEFYNDRRAARDQSQLDRFCANAAISVDDTCSINTRNRNVGIGLCVAARLLYANQGCI